MKIILLISFLSTTIEINFGELYENTLRRENLIKQLGYKLIVIWEYDWLKLNNSRRKLQKKIVHLKQLFQLPIFDLLRIWVAWLVCIFLFHSLFFLQNPQ